MSLGLFEDALDITTHLRASLSELVFLHPKKDGAVPEHEVVLPHLHLRVLLLELFAEQPAGRRAVLRAPAENPPPDGRR